MRWYIAVVRGGIAAALVSVALIGCSSSEFKSEPFPDVPDDMKRGPGLFTGESGDLDLIALTTGVPAESEADVSDFEAWKRSQEGQEQGGSGDDLSSWLGEAAPADGGTAAPKLQPAPADQSSAQLTGLEKDPDYQEYLEYKRWKEYRDFQEWKRQQQ